MTEKLNLDAVNVSVGARGQVIVDKHLMTSNPRIWAAGDVTGEAQFVYVAVEQGRLAASNALGASSPLWITMPSLGLPSPPLSWLL